jgi:hypothetical protein
MVASGEVTSPTNPERFELSKLFPAVAIGLSLTAFPLAAVVLPAVAQEDLVTVTISGEFAQALSDETGIPVDELPESIRLAADAASEVCGAPVDPGGSCVGTTSTETLTSLLESDSSTPSSSEEPSSSSEPESSSEEDNSAKASAPGQVKGDGESAKAYAPGQTKGDGESARDNAPGQQKNGGGDGGSDKGGKSNNGKNK